MKRFYEMRIPRADEISNKTCICIVSMAIAQGHLQFSKRKGKEKFHVPCHATYYNKYPFKETKIIAHLKWKKKKATNLSLCKKEVKRNFLQGRCGFKGTLYRVILALVWSRFIIHFASALLLLSSRSRLAILINSPSIFPSLWWYMRCRTCLLFG